MRPPPAIRLADASFANVPVRLVHVILAGYSNRFYSRRQAPADAFGGFMDVDPRIAYGAHSMRITPLDVCNRNEYDFAMTASRNLPERTRAPALSEWRY